MGVRGASSPIHIVQGLNCVLSFFIDSDSKIYMIDINRTI